VNASVAKPLYSASISYRTPAGRRVMFGSIIASESILECKEELCRRLQNKERFGRRRIRSILDDFNAISIGKQIPTR
jgi:hypothetical protein